MKFSELTKEQKQYIMLGAIAAVFAAYCVVNFGVTPLWSAWKTARADYEDLAAKLEDADRLMGSRDTIRENLDISQEAMNRALQEYIPELENPLSWATEKIYNLARTIGLDVQSVSETGTSVALQLQGEKKERTFGTYAVRIVVDCSYEETKQLVESLESSNPYLCVSGIKVDAKPSSPEIHSVNLTVEWPIWIDAALAADILKKEDGGDA